MRAQRALYNPSPRDYVICSGRVCVPWTEEVIVGYKEHKWEFYQDKAGKHRLAPDRVERQHHRRRRRT